MRGVAQQPLALGERLVHEAEFALLEVAQAPVHQLRGLRRRSRRQVRLVDEGYRQAAGGGVEGDARSGGATADDEQVEPLGRQPFEGAVTAEGGNNGVGHGPRMVGRTARKPSTHRFLPPCRILWAVSVPPRG